jgi:hypothetical protein
MKDRKKIICLVGSLNQTKQLHLISNYLKDDYDIYFTQLFGDGMFLKMVAESGIVDNTVFGRNSSFTLNSRDYIESNNLNYDYRANSRGINYDLALLSTDMIVPKEFRKIKTIWVQEGMIDKLGSMSRLVKKVGLPEFFTGDTSLNGTSNRADIYCSMSFGYKDYFSQWGTKKEKILVTGVPNFDNIDEFKNDSYHESGFILIATSDIRELGGNENRTDFFEKCVKIANGRKVIYKPHPNESRERVTKELMQVIPNAEIIYKPILDTLIAHCDTLITQWSSSVYVGLVLGKTVYSYFPMEELEAKKPIQNGGKSAEIIANIAREFITYEGEKSDFIAQSTFAKSLL